MQRIFAADIGGTNCRFASFSLAEGRISLERAAWIKSAGLRDTDMVLAALERELEKPLRAATTFSPVRGCRFCIVTSAAKIWKLAKWANAPLARTLRPCAGIRVFTPGLAATGF